MNFYNKRERGFTLIEALISFLIVAIGLIGAAMFQSKLIAESGASKARTVAVKLAEKELEEQRTLITDAQYDSLDAVVSAAVPVISSGAVGNTVYDISFTVASAAAASYQEHYLLSVTVDWDDARGNAASVALSSRLSRNDPENSLDNKEQAGTTGPNPNVGEIDRPTGSAVAIARETTDETHDPSKDVGGYVALGDDKYGIKTKDSVTCDSGTCDEVVSVIELIKSDSPIFKISGNIYFHDTPDNDFQTVEASPNVLTSEGGGCAVYEINSQAAYTCLFGEGWYGTISLVLPLENNGRPADTVCLSPREYKYYRIDPATVSSSIQSSDIVGQSGLVRFTTLAGVGPYLAASNAAPGLGYYYLYDQIDTSTEQYVTSTNTSGNLDNQHFVVTDATGNDSSDMPTICIQDGGANAEPLFSHTDYQLPGSYPDLSNDNYGYYDTVSGAEVAIPHDEIVLGYVNVAYEISGNIDVSGVSASAEDLEAELEVGMNPLPEFAQLCELEATSEQVIEYSCFVDYNWGGAITASVVSGSSYSLTFAPAEYDFSASPVTSDVTSKNFTASESP